MTSEVSEVIKPKTCHVEVIDTKGETQEYSLRSGLGFVALSKSKKTPLEFDCLKADCGICVMRVLKGADSLSKPTTAEADFLKAMHADPEERLACQCRVFGDVTIKVEYS